MDQFFKLLCQYFLPGAVGLNPPAVLAEFDGAAINIGSLINLIDQLQSNAAGQTGQWNFHNDTGGNVTWNSAGLPPGLASTVILCSGQAATNKTTDTALNIVAAGFPGAVIGQTALAIVANANSATATLVAGTNVTLAGVTTVLTAAARFYQLKITNLADPFAPGVAATNNTTTTAAIAAQNGIVNSFVVPVAANTGIIVGSVLQVQQSDGSFFTGKVSVVSTNNITVLGANTKPIALGAPVLVYNTTVTLQGMFSIGAGVIA